MSREQTPQEQHAAAAKKILAKRATKEPEVKELEITEPENMTASPTTQEQLDHVRAEIERLEEIEGKLEAELEAEAANTEDLDEEVGTDGDGDPDFGGLQDLTKKQLKAICDERNIKYAKKDTNETLIALIEG